MPPPQDPLLRFSPFPPVGHPSWAGAVAQALHLYFSNQWETQPGATPTPLTAGQSQQLMTILEREAAAGGEAFLDIYEPIAAEYNFAPGGDDARTQALLDMTAGLVDALTGAGSARARNILNNITETRTTREEQQVTEEEVVTGEERVTRGIHEVEFVEWPTPEAVLDDFLNGFAVFTGELLRGGLDRNTYNFMVANPNRFLLPYLDAWAQEGEFEVVGLGDAATLLGERFGGAVREETVRVGT